MKATIRGLKGLSALFALACLGLLLRWVTAGSIATATAQDLNSMASLAIGAVAWVAYGWLVIAIVATVLEQAPGAIGRGASLVAARITSQGSRALLRSALGVAAVTPLTIGVAQATPGAHTHVVATTADPHSTHQLPSPNSRPWTSVEPRSTVQLATEHPSSVQLTEQPAGRPTRGAAPTKHLPTGRTAVPVKSPRGRVVVPDRPTAGAPTRYTHLQSGQAVRAGSWVVKAGDSLWKIAAAELGPAATDEAVAARWPEWYAANRELIGPDPNVIQPGQVLNPPAPNRPVPPTHQEK